MSTVQQRTAVTRPMVTLERQITECRSLATKGNKSVTDIHAGMLKVNNWGELRKELHHGVFDGVSMFGEYSGTNDKESHCVRLDPEHGWPFLLRFQITMFGACIGTSALALQYASIRSATHGIEHDVAQILHTIFWAVAVATLVLVGFTYLLKVWFWRGAAIREFLHPTRCNFFAAPLISIMFLSLGAPDGVNEAFGGGPDRRPPLWFAIFCGVLQASWNIFVYREWFLGDSRSIRNNNPTYQIAVVGNFIMASLAGSIDNAVKDYSLAFIAVGIIIWLVVFITLFQMVSIRNDKGIQNHLPPDIHPTLFLFIAPPSAAATAIANFEGKFGTLSRSWLFFAFFMYLLVLSGFRSLIKGPITTAHWAFTFPLIALTNAIVAFYLDLLGPGNHCCANTHLRLMNILWRAQYIIALLLVAIMWSWTAWNAYKGKLFPDDPLVAIVLLNERDPETSRPHNEEGTECEALPPPDNELFAV